MISDQQILAPDLDFAAAVERLRPVVRRTPLSYNAGLSRRYDCEVYLKREDLQVVRSYKLRGAYNLMASLPAEVLEQGVVCASAGNHAQGFAWSCRRLGVRGTVFMPIITPQQKVAQTRLFGDGWIDVKLVGDTFDDCAHAARQFTEAEGLTFIPPFDHQRIIEGQATVGVEIMEEQPVVDYLFLPVGGGGLCAGVGSYFGTFSPQTKIIGAEPAGAPSMTEALRAGGPVTLAAIDRFVDGAAVKAVGSLTFPLCRAALHDMCLVPEGKVCTVILQLYNEEGIVVEPAGALSIAALEQYREAIRGRKVVCIVSGSNNDIERMQEIKERSLQEEGLKHYFLIRFAQRPGALKEFVSDVLGPTDDITRFEYMKKHSKDTGPALVGIELAAPEDYEVLLRKMADKGINYVELNKDADLFQYLV